ncbi:disease resistance protein At4g27190-like [Acetobacter orientalis]|uniref:Disease resistance protein At4g27190-like n=1 Tax=Acetobacter orientalis TaxID=146474 RepID=A0A2Z5ZH12_9PROT|nr:disease resistance protein At4g27190-like [Acetobacter orientalis]
MLNTIYHQPFHPVNSTCQKIATVYWVCLTHLCIKQHKLFQF